MVKSLQKLEKGLLALTLFQWLFLEYQLTVSIVIMLRQTLAVEMGFSHTKNRVRVLNSLFNSLILNEKTDLF